MANEVKTVSSLALLYAFRMIGLFMVLPVLMVYGDHYEGATPVLLGLALGVYGLTQAIFQIPLGLFSDIVGRKPIIIGGLIIFAIGSVVAATANSIEGLILGRALQGSGAIASAIMAMVADLTSEQNRTRAMAAIGASIGLSFSVSMILGPALAAASGIGGVFFLAAVLALAGIAIVVFVVPTPQQSGSHRDTGAIPTLFVSTLKNAQLLRLDFGIFSLHAILMAMFVAIPVLLESELGLAKDAHWQVYLPVLVLAFVGMLPLMIFAEKKRKIKPVFLFAIVLIGLSNIAIGQFFNTVSLALVFIFVFFLGFNLLEAMLPSLVSKISPVGAKGTAMGVYSTSQFLGAFCGGVLGGYLLQNYSIATVFFCAGSGALVWLLFASTMQAPRHLSSLCLAVRSDFSDASAVEKMPGVEEVLFVVEESLLYLKVDKTALDEAALIKFTQPEAS